ncbi:MAG: hypothetical protein RQ833_08960 [Sphingomonadaceae bacterium]|nr:hypothetical protein [Sphingomonadaceae bacterium]
MHSQKFSLADGGTISVGVKVTMDGITISRQITPRAKSAAGGDPTLCVQTCFDANGNARVATCQCPEGRSCVGGCEPDGTPYVGCS